jgi:large repetitive protein
VSYRRGSGSPVSVFTGTNGAYSIPGRDPYATWEVTFDATTATTATEQRQPMTFYVLPTAATTVTLNYALSLKSGSIEVTVVSGLKNQTLTTAIVSNATVVLTDTASSPLINPVTVTATAAAPLDAKVVIPSLPVNGAGVYRVSVTAPGYVDAAGNALPVFASDISVANGITTKVKVILYPVAQDVTVRVKDPNGDLLDGVDVTLGGGGLVSATRTGTTVSGVVTWPDIPVSPSGGAAYTIAIAASGYTPGTLGSYYVPAGAPATLDVQLRSVTVTANETSSSATGTTLSDAAISATVPGGTVPSFTSNGTGGFEVQGVLPTGTWTISASRAGYTTKTATLAVSTTSGFKPSATVTLLPAPTVVKVQSSLSNSALAGVIVHAVSNDSPAATTVDSLVTPANGMVSLALVPGAWTISTTNATTLPAGHHADTPGTSLSIPLPAGSPATTLTLDKHETLTVLAKGRVSASSTPALAGVTLTASRATGSPVILGSTGTTGVYSYTGPLAAGDYALSATATDYADLAPGTIVTVVADSANAAKSVTLDHLESLTITVNGRTSSAAATPLSGATITANAGTTTVTLTPTGTAGEYSYVGELSGTYTITASKNGFATDSTTTVTAVSYGDATDTVTLNHLEKITLTLTGSSATSTASALSGAAVTTVIGTTTVTFTEIGTTGVYVYEGRLSGSSYVVQAVKDGYTTGTVTVTRVQYGDAPDNLTLTAQTQTLTVTVQDNLAAVVGSIQVKATQGSTSLSGTTDATTGTYDFTLAPGVWVITATVPYTDATPTTYSTSTSHTVTVPIGSGTTQTVTVSP